MGVLCISLLQLLMCQQIATLVLAVALTRSQLGYACITAISSKSWGLYALLWATGIIGILTIKHEDVFNISAKSLSFFHVFIFQKLGGFNRSLISRFLKGPIFLHFHLKSSSCQFAVNQSVAVSVNHDTLYPTPRDTIVNDRPSVTPSFHAFDRYTITVLWFSCWARVKVPTITQFQPNQRLNRQ